MPKLEIVLANPEVRRVDRPDATWLLVGCDEYDAVRLEQSGNDRDEIEAEICARAGDATIIKVVHSKGQAHRVSAWRGPTSVHEVFRLERRNGDLIIADHFRNLLARLPMGERTPSDDAIIDHFIFRATLATTRTVKGSRVWGMESEFQSSSIPANRTERSFIGSMRLPIRGRSPNT